MPMQVWKLTPLLSMVLAIGACSSKPVEQAATEVPAPPPTEVAASSEPSQPTEPPPVPVAKPSNLKACCE